MDTSLRLDEVRYSLCDLAVVLVVTGQQYNVGCDVAKAGWMREGRAKEMCYCGWACGKDCDTCAACKSITTYQTS